MPDNISAAEAALMAITSWGLCWSAPSTVMTTWVSLRNPSANFGRGGRSGAAPPVPSRRFPPDAPAGYRRLTTDRTPPSGCHERTGDRWSPVKRSSTQAEPGDDGSIALHVGGPYVVEHAAPAADEHQ